ncbi:MAG: LolA family protein [Planctomycetota bacterium]
MADRVVPRRAVRRLHGGLLCLLLVLVLPLAVLSGAAADDAPDQTPTASDAAGPGDETDGTDAPGDDLLGRILAAQADHQTAVGKLEKITRQAEFPDMEPQRFLIDAWIQRPDSYHLRFVQPLDDEGTYEAYVSDGETAWKVVVFDPEVPAVIDAEPVQENDPMGRIAEFLPLRRAALEEDFDLSASPLEAGGSQVELQPKTADMAKNLKHILITFDEAHEVHEVRIHYTDGNLDILRVHELAHPDHIDPERFQVRE